MTEGPSRPRRALPTSVGSLPGLPASYERALDTGLRQLALELPAEARQSLDDHVRLMLAWNRAINLTAVRDPAEVALRHVLDSLTALPLLAPEEAVLDVGSGAGYPGLPLTVARPASRALLVESIGKKARFLDTAIAALGLGERVMVAAERAESLARVPVHRGRWPVVTARAIGDLAEVVELAFPLLSVGGRLIAWKKRADVEPEIRASARVREQLGGGEIASRAAGLAALPDHWLVIATKRRPTPDAYPREPGVRKRRRP